MRRFLLPAAVGIIGVAAIFYGFTLGWAGSGSTSGIAGSYPSELNLQSDPCGHDPFIFSQQPPPHNIKLTVVVDAGFISISGPSPWVKVSSQTFPGTGMQFTATGSGTVAGFPNTAVQFQGSIDGNTITGKYTFGNNNPPGKGGLPPCGQPGTEPVPHPAVYGVKPKPTSTPTRTATATPSLVCDLAIRKTMSPNPVQSGQPLTISLTVTNVGTGPCQGVTKVSDGPLPWLQILSVAQGGTAWNCSVTPPNPGATVSCTWPPPVPLGPLQKITITGNVVALSGAVTNCATVSNPNDTVDSPNNESCVDIEVTPTSTATPTPCGAVGAICTPTPTATICLGAAGPCTPTPTRTPTHSDVPTATATPCGAIGAICTPTPTVTRTPTRTPTHSDVPTATATPCSVNGAICTPTPTATACIGGPVPCTPTPTPCSVNGAICTPTPTRTPTPRPTNPPPNGACTKTGQNVAFQGATWDALWKCAPDPASFRFDRIDIFVGTATQDPSKLDPLNPPRFQCQSTSQVVIGVFKGYKKNVNPGTTLPHHEVWSANFDGKCQNGVNVYLQTSNPNNHAVIQAVAFTNSSGQPTATATRTPTRTATRTPTPHKACGDVNDDGHVNSVDASLLLQLSAGRVAQLPNMASADTNRDGSVNAVDATVVLQIDARLIAGCRPATAGSSVGRGSIPLWRITLW